MLPLARFLIGSWSGVALTGCLVVLPTALAVGIDPTACILPPFILFAVRMVENGVGRSPIEVIRHGQ